MECVRAGLGREAAHQLIKKHSTSTTAGNFFEVLAGEKDFPLSFDQLKDLIADPSDFAGMAAEQSKYVANKIKLATNGRISKVELTQLR
jgi:adenylosuccinate lyase